MLKSSSRRLVLTLVLGSSFLAFGSIAHAQTTSTPTGVSTNGVTGTDPVPTSCGCKKSDTPQTTTSTTTNGTPVSTTGTLAQVLLTMLGLS